MRTGWPAVTLNNVLDDRVRLALLRPGRRGPGWSLRIIGLFVGDDASILWVRQTRRPRSRPLPVMPEREPSG